MLTSDNRRRNILVPLICGAIGCTLRSGLHEIPTVIRTFPHWLENNHAWKWTSDNFPGMLRYVLFLKNCKKKFFFGWFGLTKHGGNHSSWWIRYLWSKGISQILAYFEMFLSFCKMGYFFCFWVFLVHSENHASQWIRDLWSKTVSLILAYF